MNFEDFHKICRICTSSGTLLSLHEHKLKELLQKITDLQFTLEDKFPENICMLCSEKLESIEIFIDKCKKNSIIFENVLQLKEEEKKCSEQEDDVENNLSLSENDDPYPDPTADGIIESDRINEALRDIEEIEQNDEQITDKGKCRTCGERLPLGGIKIHYQNRPECTPKCPICSKSFYTTIRLKCHILSHEKKPSYKCPACKMIFPWIKWLRKHVLQKHPDFKPFLCKVCHKGFLKKLSLDEHMNLHTGATPYICAYCGIGFQRRSLYTRHIYHSHNSDAQKIPKLKRKYTEKRVHLHLECEDCGKVFASRSGFATHQLNHKGVLSFLCSLCGKKCITNAALQAHILKHTGETPFKCKCCGKGFKTKFVLAKHETLHNLKSLHCPECNEQFQIESDFNNHMLKHGKHDSPLTCPECPQKFYHELILQNHLVSHRDKERKKCTLCNKSFALSYFSSHMRLHTGEKAFRCEVCGKSFTLSKTLKIHMRLHTGELPYSCSVCYKRFSDPSNRNSHFKKCHGKIARCESSSGKVALEEDNV